MELINNNLIGRYGIQFYMHTKWDLPWKLQRIQEPKQIFEWYKQQSRNEIHKNL